MNVGAVREALAEALREIPSVQVSPYALAQPTPPGIQILPPQVIYDLAMARGLDELVFLIQGFVAMTSDVGSQMLLDEMCATSGASSVKALVEADKTLGGVVEDLRVQEQLPARVVDAVGGNPMLLVEWRVSVYANGA